MIGRAALAPTALVAESFVDPEQFVGACYKAAAWHCPDAAHGSPTRSLTLSRDHWGAIENDHHHRRDRACREDTSPVRDPNATSCYAALRAVAILLMGQHKRVQKRPERYHLPDLQRAVRFRITRACLPRHRRRQVIGWLRADYEPP